MCVIRKCQTEPFHLFTFPTPSRHLLLLPHILLCLTGLLSAVDLQHQHTNNDQDLPVELNPTINLLKVKWLMADDAASSHPVQEMVLLRSQMSGQINVAVDAGPSTDLNQVMTDIRDHYEGVIGKNRKELESWYQNKVRRLKTTLEFRIHLVRTVGLRASLLFVLCAQMAAVEQDVKTHTEILVTSRTEMKELKSTLQRLQIELQSHLSMVCMSWTATCCTT